MEKITPAVEKIILEWEKMTAKGQDSTCLSVPFWEIREVIKALKCAKKP